MRRTRSLIRSKPGVLLIMLAVFLAIIACEVPAEVATLPEQGGQSGQPVEAPGQPLETLAPLPHPVEGEDLTEPDGETYDVNDVRWTIIQAVELGGVLPSESDAVDDLVANGRLIGVRFAVENTGDDPLTFVGMRVVDDQDGSYAYLSDGLAFIVDAEACQMEQLEPGAVLLCTAIYDVAVDATGLQAVLTDLNMLGGQEVPVDLGLE